MHLSLLQVARAGVTVAAVIHQPSHLVFGMFDDLLLLGKGGRTVYYGPQPGVQSYFESLGYEMPSQVGGRVDRAACWWCLMQIFCRPEG